MKVSGLDDTIAWYDQNAEKYAKASETAADIDQIDELVALLPLHAKLLDAGCAAGRDSQLFTERGCDVKGVDISSGLIDIAKKSFPNIMFEKMDILNLNFANSSFDAIWSHQSLLHLETIEDVRKALSEFSRVLVQNGVLSVMVKAQMGSAKTAIVADSLSNHDRFFQYFTGSEIKSLLREAGFKILRIEEYRESNKRPDGRPEVGLIYSLSAKI